MSSSTVTKLNEDHTMVVVDGPSSYWKIIFNVPNTIGHIRLLFLSGFVLLDTFDNSNKYAQVCCLMLSSSIFLDSIDGMAARAFDQCTRFGYHYDIFLDCMVPISVYGQCQNIALLKSFTGAYAFGCTCWSLLAMSTSWKVGKQPKYWPASALTNTKKDGGGQFSSFGSLLWYFGFATFFPMIYALDRDLINFGIMTLLLFTFAMLNLVSLLEYNGMHMQLLLDEN